MWLNLDRQIVRQSAPTSMGIGVALSGSIKKEYFDNFTDRPGEAQLLAHRSERAARTKE